MPTKTVFRTTLWKAHSGKHRTRWALRALRLSGWLQPEGLIQADDTSDPTASPGGLPDQPLLQRQGYAMSELGRGRPVGCGRVYLGFSGATNLGDGLAHSVAGLVADPHLLLRGEAGAQSLELIQDGLVGKHLDFVLSFQAQVKQQVLLHAGGVYAVTINEEPAEGPQVRRQKEEGSWMGAQTHMQQARPSGNQHQAASPSSPFLSQVLLCGLCTLSQCVLTPSTQFPKSRPGHGLPLMPLLPSLSSLDQ